MPSTPQADLLPRSLAVTFVAGGGSHHVAIGHPHAVDGRAPEGGHDGAEHLAHHDGAILLMLRSIGEHFRVAAHPPEAEQMGHAAEGVNAVDLQLNQP